MQVVKYIFIASILVLSQAAGAASPVFGSVSETRYARGLTPPKGKSLIYIYQGKQGGAVSPKIWLNNYEIGRIVPGSFTVWQLAPGKLELRVDGPNPAKLSLVSQAGKVYLFRLDVTGNSAEIENLPQSYRSDLVSLRLIKNPRQVTAETTPPPAKTTVTEATTPPPSAKPAPRPQSHYHQHTEASLLPGGMAILLKTGSFNLSKQDQTILGTNESFKKSVSGLYDIEVDSQFSNGEALGGELLGYKAQYTTVGPSGTGDVSVVALLANAKLYYRTHSPFQPYIGAGLGIAVTDVSGAIIGKTAGFAYQLLAGVEYRTASVGVFAEAKYLNANTKDSNSNKIDVSGSGVLAGIAFHF